MDLLRAPCWKTHRHSSFDSASHTSHCCGVLVTITLNIRRWKERTPHRSKMQRLHNASRGSPKTLCSRSSGVFDVFSATAAFALSKPIGMPSPPSPSSKSIGHSLTEHSVDPTLQNRRRLTPQVGMDDDNAVR
jgi:hypothetical protein